MFGDKANKVIDSVSLSNNTVHGVLKNMAGDVK
jgi:hypothetical protein